MLIIFMPMLCSGQSAPKWTNQIIVKGTDFNMLAQALISKGFMLDKTDKDLQLITTTAPRTFKGLASSVKLQIYLKDSSAYITGQFKLEVKLFKNSEESFESIVNRGMKGSEYKDTFDFMDEFAKSLKGELTYSKL